MNRLLVGIAALTLGLVAAGGASAQDRVKAGTLDCDVSGGIGMIIGSQKGVRCEFTPDFAGPREYYTGTISKFGLDIGATSAGRMVWAVFAPSTRTPGVLAGVYSGATAEATAVVGLGANALVGGSNRTVALQPLSITGQTGLNLAAGVASLELRSAN
jgi:Protein of unknown function (DUF992)